MANTKDGGAKTAATNKAKYGEDFYSKLGKLGAAAYKERLKQGIAKPRGFALMDKDKVSAAGRKGGSVSKRGPRER